MLWWRRKYADIERGLCKISTWEEFKKELKRQFYPENVVYEARKKLRELKHKTTISEYVQEFTSLTLQIPNLSGEELLFNFIDGLQNWAKHELQRRGVKDVDEAIVVAESLTEYQREKGEASRPKSPRPSHEQSGGDKGQGMYQGGGDKRVSQRNQHEGSRKTHKELQCFVCKGPHRMKDCPKLGSLSAMVERAEEEANVERVGSLRLLNAIKGKPLSKNEGLMYVDGKINGKPVTVMCDTGATHNFITPEEAKRIGLKVRREGGSLKAVNSPPTQCCGIAQGVELGLGSWRGKVDFSVAPMDDFTVVLGLKFFRQVNAHPMPYYNSLCILEKGASCMIPAKRKGSGHQLSALQLKKGLKKVEGTYLATLEEGEPRDKVQEGDPPSSTSVLGEDQDMMSPKLPVKLLPQREVDHTVKLEPGGRSPAMGTNRMVPPKRRKRILPNRANMREDTTREKSRQIPPVKMKSYDHQIEGILNHRVVRRRWVPPSTQYLVKWKGLPGSEATQEAREDLWQFDETPPRCTSDEGVTRIGGGECHDREVRVLRKDLENSR